MRRRPALEWETLLAGAGVPAARILTVAQATELEQLHERGFFTDLPFPADPDRTLRVSGNGVLIDGSPLRPPGPPPLLGQHNAEFRSVEEVPAP